jgi:hypothetical protein
LFEHPDFNAAILAHPYEQGYRDAWFGEADIGIPNAATWIGTDYLDGRADARDDMKAQDD